MKVVICQDRDTRHTEELLWVARKERTEGQSGHHAHMLAEARDQRDKGPKEGDLV